MSMYKLAIPKVKANCQDCILIPALEATKTQFQLIVSTPGQPNYHPQTPQLSKREEKAKIHRTNLK